MQGEEMTIASKPLKPKACAVCKRIFTPFRAMTKVCSVPCSLEYARKMAARKEAKAAREERKATREAKVKLKTRREWIAEAQVIVNKVARLRDIRDGHGCISCGIKLQARFGGAFDAGHFRSVGSAPHLRFFLPNLALQCKKCNRDRGGMHSDFRKGLIERRGFEFVERIEAMQGTAKWSIEYLQRLKRIMNKKARRLERRIEMNREAA
jgi:5-methylcytosine-specific restriction endonuclease McrA